jgi:hypothetical protein
MKTENLNGTLVLVRPDLENDPARSQGKVGFIQYTPTQMDGLYVSLLTGQEGFYKPDELLRLKPKQEISKELFENATNLPLDDFKALYKIGLLQERGTTASEINALEIARDHPSVWSRSLTAVAAQQSLELAKTYSR